MASKFGLLDHESETVEVGYANRMPTPFNKKSNVATLGQVPLVGETFEVGQNKNQVQVINPS